MIYNYFYILIFNTLNKSHFTTGPITIGRTGPQCRVLYCAGPGQVPDLAVLKMTTPHHHKHTQPLVTNLSDSYRVGDDVAIISYGLVRPRDDDDGPVVTKGAISKVICHNGTPVMIQVWIDCSIRVF